MAILSSKSAFKKTKHVGASLPFTVSSYLVLFTLAKGISKSKILATVLENWIAMQRCEKQNTETQLIREIVERSKTQLNIAMENGKKRDYFLKKLKTELIKKGVSENIACEIIKEIH